MSDDTTLNQLNAFCRALRERGVYGAENAFTDLRMRAAFGYRSERSEEMFAAALAAAFRTAEAEAWQPIETAPKDGTRVLVFEAMPDGEAPLYNVAHWVRSILPNEPGAWVIIHGDCWVTQPTHWRPLPEPPR